MMVIVTTSIGSRSHTMHRPRPLAAPAAARAAAQVYPSVSVTTVMPVLCCACLCYFPLSSLAPVPAHASTSIRPPQRWRGLSAVGPALLLWFRSNIAKYSAVQASPSRIVTAPYLEAEVELEFVPFSLRRPAATDSQESELVRGARSLAALHYVGHVCPTAYSFYAAVGT